MPKALYSGIKTFWGRNSPSVGQALAGHAGHLFVLCPRDRAAPLVMGSWGMGYRGCSWKAGLMHPGHPGPEWTSTSRPEKLCFFL